MTHMPGVHNVGIVVDRNFASGIADLARSFHVWVVESPQNVPAIEQFRRDDRSGGDPLATGITSFKAGDEESPQAMCARIAADVDDHHGAFAHDPPWSEISVYGATLDERLRDAFASIGATSFELAQGGFVCRR